MSIVPPRVPGITWRAAALTDAAGLAELAAAVDAVEDLDVTGGPEFWRWWLPQHDLAADTVVGSGDGGRIVAVGGSYATDTDTGSRAIVWFEVAPDRLDLEAPLLAAVTGRGREQLRTATHPGGVVRVSVEEHRQRRRELLERSGFREARLFVEMRRSLDGRMPGPAEAPPGVEVVVWDPDLDEAVRLASNAAFADHWGSLPMDHETWASMVIDEEVIRRDQSRLALVDGRVVAFCLAEVDPEEDPGELWIDRIGTVPSHRRRGLATHLLSTTLRSAAATGLRTAALTVDSANRTDATAVYARLGFEVQRRSVTYLLEDRP